MTPPVLGGFFKKTAARHHCRTCGRTVCNSCSSVPSTGLRTCKGCYVHSDAAQHQAPQEEKYVFLIRHAQSTWNQQVDLVKTCRNLALEDVCFKDVVSGAASIMSREVWHRDHPISAEGVRQTEDLRRKIAAARRACCEEAVGVASTCPDSSTEREQRYYSRFLEDRERIYCSPLLRALQTAQLALPEEEGWGSIKLLRDARESFRFVFERDCLGTGVGLDIARRAMQMGLDLPGLDNRVDAADCLQKWWSDEPETEAEIECRIDALWKRLFEEEAGANSCVLVTHSNFIKALLMRHGDGGATEVGAGDRSEFVADCPDDVEDRDGVADEPASDSFMSASEEDQEGSPSASWQVVSGGCQALRQVKTERLQNCGVLGLRCVREAPCPSYREIDGWIDIDGAGCPVAATDARWVAKDALLMFETVLVQ